MTNIFSFDVITFNDRVHRWVPTACSSCIGISRYTKNWLKSEAEEMILQLQAGGSTDINAALSMAIQIAKVFKIYEDVKQPMIIFLTDGRPSSGITSNEVIKSEWNFQRLNWKRNFTPS